MKTIITFIVIAYFCIIVMASCYEIGYANGIEETNKMLCKIGKPISDTNEVSWKDNEYPLIKLTDYRGENILYIKPEIIKATVDLPAYDDTPARTRIDTSENYFLVKETSNQIRQKIEKEIDKFYSQGIGLPQ